MKTKYLALFSLIAFCFLNLQCGKDSATLTLPITDTGANTFGCLVDGRALLPRDGVVTVDAPYPHKGIEVVFGPDKKSLDLKLYDEKDHAPTPFFLDIHLSDSSNVQPGIYNWQQTSYAVGYVDNRIHHLFGSFYDNETKNYEWFGSYDNSGTTTIIKVDSINHIISGTFSGKFQKRDDSTKKVTISNGRFDINWGSVSNKKFP